MKGLYAITDATLLPGEKLLSQTEQVLKHGISLLQYRDKLANSDTRKQRASALLTLCRRYDTALIINDDIELASQLGCGVHLGKDDGEIALARHKLGKQAIIGASCYNNLDTAETALAAGASYIAFGRFFSSTTKPLASPAEPAVLKAAKRKFSAPIVAIGGITPDNGRQLVNAGADMLAVIAGLWQADDINAQCQCYSALFDDQSLPS